MDDLIYRKDAIGVLSAQCYRGTDFEDVCGKDCECAEYMAMRDLPSAQPEDWMERNKERILQAGMEGREIEFRIGGRLFAIREKAQ